VACDQESLPVTQHTDTCLISVSRALLPKDKG
jgi:hypothetical protein